VQQRDDVFRGGNSKIASLMNENVNRKTVSRINTIARSANAYFNRDRNIGVQKVTVYYRSICKGVPVARD
jgi:hypothetical protein